MQENKFLLYGANGYTGRLIASMAHQFDLVPVLAGRNDTALSAMAKELSLEYITVDLNDSDKLVEVLQSFKVVLHAAGPFMHTALKMAKACIKAGVHYLDITGEIGVFELLKKMGSEFEKCQRMVMPGVGFDVVPTDCMAKFLHDQMPDATHLKLAFASVGGKLSHGTATTMADGMGEGGAVRENGRIIKKPLGHKGMWVNFSSKKLFTMTIPWGDISTAYTTTRIPNIETYTSVSPKTFSMLKWQGLYNWVLKLSLVRNYYKNKIKKMPAGPDEAMRKKAKSLVWGEVTNAEGKSLYANIEGPEGYTLTALSSLIILKKVLCQNYKTGYQTPAACYGADLVLEIPGVTRTMASSSFI